MDTLYHSPLFDHIREYFRSSHPDDAVFLFVPYIKTTILEKLLEGIPNRIVVVTTWEPRDILSGSSDLSLYPFCQRHDIALYVSQGLHLKMYSVGLASAILATGNVSRRGLMPDGNHEAGVLVESISASDRMFLEGIRHGSRLVDNAMYEALEKWHDDNKIDTEYPKLNDIVPERRKDDFLISALPMTRTVDLLTECYMRLSARGVPSEDEEVTACVYHDLVNYGIGTGLTGDVFRRILSAKFFAHPFIARIDKIISPEAYFGEMKEWVQNNCADVPVPSRRELTGNVQVLYDWFASLGNGRYVVDVPGKRSQRLSKKQPT